MGGMRVDISDDMAVTFQPFLLPRIQNLESLIDGCGTNHCLYFSSHIRQSFLIRDSNPLQDSYIGSIDRPGESNKVDMSESSWNP